MPSGRGAGAGAGAGAGGAGGGGPLIAGAPLSNGEFHGFVDDDFAGSTLFDSTNSPDALHETWSADDKSRLLNSKQPLDAMTAPDSPTPSLLDSASDSTSFGKGTHSSGSKSSSTAVGDVSMDEGFDETMDWGIPEMSSFDNEVSVFGFAPELEPSHLGGLYGFGELDDAPLDNPFDFDSAPSSSPDPPDPPANDAGRLPLEMPLMRAQSPPKPRHRSEGATREARAPGHRKRSSQWSASSSIAGQKREASGEPSPMSMGTNHGLSPLAPLHGTPSPNMGSDMAVINGVPMWTANPNMPLSFANGCFTHPTTFQQEMPIPHQMLAFGNASTPSYAGGVCELWIDTTPVKSRVETQIPIRMILSPVPPGISKLHLPSHTISKPKLMARPPPEPSPDTLELFVSLVCTSAMDNPALKRKALDRATRTPQGHLPDPNDEENSPQNGGEVRICSGCITRERKRAARKKIKKPEEDRLWSQDEERRVVVFNTHELKEWQPFTGLQNRNGRPEPPRSNLTMQLDAPMRIACYCRHHNEKLGFNVIFTIKDWQGQIVAQDMSQRIMITDDHKTNPMTQLATTQPPVPDAIADLPTPMHHSTPMDVGTSMPPATNGAFGGFSPSSAIHLSNSQPPFRPASHASAKTTPAMPAAAAPGQQSLSRPHSPSQMGPLAKKRKSSASSVPQGLTMTRLDISPSQAPAGVAGSIQASTASSPFSPNSTPTPNPTMSQTPSLGPFSPTDALFGQFNPQGPFTTLGAPSTSSHEMPFFGSRRSGSMDNLAMAQLFSSAPTSNHASRAPSPNGLRNSQLMQPLNGNMVSMPVNLDRPRPSPVIHKVIPNEGPTVGGIEVTVLGASFYQGIEVWFGDTKATTTTFWGESSLVCLLPPSPGARAVPVTLGPQNMATPNMQLKPPPFFRYIDESEDKLIRTALSVLGSKMSGQVVNVNDLARRILSVGSSGWTGGSTGGSSANGSLLNHMSRGHLEAQVLKLLDFISLEESAWPARLDTPSPTGHTMLHFACALGQYRLVATLLSMGANVNARDRGGFTPLHLAAIYDQAPIVERLMGAGADLTIQSLSGLRPRDVGASRAVERLIRQTQRHLRTRSGGLLQSRTASVSSMASLQEPWLSSHHHAREEPRPLDFDEESLEYTSGDFEDEDPDENRQLDGRRPSQATLEDVDTDEEGPGGELLNNGIASNTTAMAAAFKDQIQTQLHQLQQTMGLYIQNLAALSQAGMPQMPTFSGDYQAYFPQAPFMRKVQQLVPGMSMSANRTDVAGAEHQPEADAGKDDASSSPPAYDDIFPRESVDCKTQSAARAAADAEADMKCAALFDEQSSSLAVISSTSSSKQEIPAVLEIGRKHAITKEQQDNFLRAREQNLKRLSSDRNLFFLWIPLLVAMVCALLYSYCPWMFHFLWSSLRAVVAQDDGARAGRVMDNAAGPDTVVGA